MWIKSFILCFCDSNSESEGRWRETDPGQHQKRYCRNRGWFAKTQHDMLLPTLSPRIQQ